MIKPDELQLLSPFSKLSQATRQAISRRAFIRNYPEGQALVIEGDPADFGYFLISGQVRVLRMSEEGRLQILGRFGPGAPLNIISLLMDRPVNRASIEALTSLTALVITAEDFIFFLHNCIDFSNMMLKIVAQRMAGMTDLVASLSLYSVRARLAQFLMELADHPYTAGGWTQEEIAAQIGTVRDVVGRILRDFIAQGLIERDRQQITLLDRQRLMDIADQQES
jgi:CRP/FNR family transcriptional regulator, cyclic AMP receptor protein